jgi:LysR family transcriptional regulator, glycine cleavage system transcriptional activator
MRRPPSRWLLPRLGRLREKYPELEVTLSTSATDSLTESGGLDCAIRFGNGEWDNVDYSLLMHEQHIAVCAPALVREAGGELKNLSKMALLHVLANESKRFMTWPQWLDAAGLQNVDVRGGYEFDVLDMAIRAAVDGLGITIADRHMVSRELADGRLVQFSNVQTEGHQSYWFVTRKDQPHRDVVELFRSWLQSELADAAQRDRYRVTGKPH